MSDPIRIPGWLRRKVIDKFNSGVSHIFILHFNVGDYFPVQDEFLTLQEMLNELCGQREIVATYNYPSGLQFLKPEMEPKFRRLVSLSSRDILPSGTHQSLYLMDRLLKNEALPPRQIALVLPFAETLFPAGSNLSLEEKANTITMLRWANERGIAVRKPIIFLITNNLKDMANQLVSASQGIEQVQVPKPELTERKLYIDYLVAHNPALKLEATAEEFAHHTQGLSLNRVEDIVLRALSEGSSITTDSVVARKVEILEQEYGTVLEIIRPLYGLDAVGGLNYAVEELKQIAEIMKRGLSSAAPMGVILMGPPGTGKSYLAECFARECGLLCVRFKPLRDMYVGQSERNQERAFAAIRALAPVVVMVDESDQQQTSRDSGSGDSGVTERMRAQAFEFWGDQSLRGKVLRMDLTNRVDLIDSAMRRSGRTDIKIPILMPDTQARNQILHVLVVKHHITTDVTDFSHYAEATEGFSGSDLELVLTTAYRFASLEFSGHESGVVVRKEHLDRALGDFIPSLRNQEAIDRMTMIALDECRSRRLLPPNFEQIREKIARRLGET